MTDLTRQPGADKTPEPNNQTGENATIKAAMTNANSANAAENIYNHAVTSHILCVVDFD